jgi:hypothetical protein
MDTNQHKCKKIKQAPPQYSKEAAALELNLIQPLNLKVNLQTQCKMLSSHHKESPQVYKGEKSLIVHQINNKQTPHQLRDLQN